MEVLLNNNWQALRKGDAANQAHGYRNTCAESAFFHNIIHYTV